MSGERTTIDLTDRYHLASYMEGGPAAWSLDRNRYPVRAVVLHHTAGWYGDALDMDASTEAERTQVDALARDHRARFGIGPGYHYLAFPSGRLYAVGKWGTQRAHTTGRDPATGERWNVQAVGLCAFGDYERDTPTPALVAALRGGMEEARRIAGQPLPVLPHGRVPSADAAGRRFEQATACPGRLLADVGGPPAPGTGIAEARRILLAARDGLDRVAALLDASC